MYSTKTYEELMDYKWPDSISECEEIVRPFVFDGDDSENGMSIYSSASLMRSIDAQYMFEKALNFIIATKESEYSADTIKARLAVNADPSRTPKAKVLAVADYAEKQDAQLQKIFEKAADDLLKRIAHKTKPVEEYAGIGNVTSEIRSHLKSLDRQERMAFLNEALDRGDEKSIKSILGAPSYLSGLTDLEHRHYTKLFHQKTHPEISTQIDLMSSALDKLKKAHKVIRKQFDEAIGASAVEVAKLRAANSSAEEALVIKNLLGGEA